MKFLQKRREINIPASLTAFQVTQFLKVVIKCENGAKWKSKKANRKKKKKKRKSVENKEFRYKKER